MKLLIDVGNTKIQALLTEAPFEVYLDTSVRTSKDALESLVHKIKLGLKSAPLKSIHIASVVPDINSDLESFLFENFQLPVHYLNFKNQKVLDIKIKDPHSLGADRIAASLGGLQVVPNSDLIIIDMGTATTIEVVTKNKEYLGGYILAGLNLMNEALASKTAQLPKVEVKKPLVKIGVDTHSCLQAGLYYGHLMQFKGLINLIEEEYPKKEFKIIGTGGLSLLYKKEKIFDHHEPYLIFKGLCN